MDLGQPPTRGSARYCRCPRATRADYAPRPNQMRRDGVEKPVRQSSQERYTGIPGHKAEPSVAQSFTIGPCRNRCNLGSADHLNFRRVEHHRVRGSGAQDLSRSWRPPTTTPPRRDLYYTSSPRRYPTDSARSHPASQPDHHGRCLTPSRDPAEALSDLLTPGRLRWCVDCATV